MIRWLGSLVGFFVGSVLRIRRAEVEERIAASQLEHPGELAREMYRSLGIGLIELLLTMVAPTKLLSRVRLTPRAEEALSKLGDRGAVIATAHLGNWDLVACAIASRTRLSVVTKRLSIRVLDRLWQRVRRDRHVGQIDLQGSLSQAIQRARSGELLGMMIDQAPRFREGALSIDFLGRPAWHDPSPAIVAARANRPLVIAFSRRLPSGEHEVDVPLVLEPPSRAAKSFVSEATLASIRALEDAIRVDPSAWLWLHRRWKDVPSRRGLGSPRVVRALA